MSKILIILYANFLAFFFIFSYAFVDPNLSYLSNLYSGFALSNRHLTTFFYTFLVCIFFVFYIIFIWLGIRKKIYIKDIFLLIAITVGILLLSYPAMLSNDVFNYIATSKVTFFYKENPYIIMPIEFIGDPLLSFMHAANKIALYGPFWIILTEIPHILGFGNFILTLFTFKLFIVFFYLATVFLFWKMSKNIISVILFSLNPLVIIETLINGHNDIVMVFFVISSFFLLMKKSILFAISLLILSILIKYATIILVPVFLYVIWKMIKNEEINWRNIFYFSYILMFAVFLISPIREEIYSWYAIWFLSFAFLISEKKFLINISIIFSISLLLRYTPYMLTGTYAGQTPLTKEIITFVLPILYCIYYVFKKKI